MLIYAVLFSIIYMNNFIIPDGDYSTTEPPKILLRTEYTSSLARFRSSFTGIIIIFSAFQILRINYCLTFQRCEGKYICAMPPIFEICVPNKKIM